MAALNLFPARVAFVNPDGTLTNEAYRALQMVFGRVGGALGDSGADVFGQVFGVASEATSLMQTDVVQPAAAPATVNAETVQPANFGTDYYGDVVQYLSPDLQFTDIVQPPSKDLEAGIFTTLDVSGNASIGGTLKLAAGTVALPSLYLAPDTTTGFYRIGANNNGYAVSGVKVLDIAGAGLVVTGALSATGSISGINGGFTLVTTRGNDTDTVFQSLNTFASNAQDFAVLHDTGNIKLGSVRGSTKILAGNAVVATVSTIGLAVTGSLSVTGAAGINGKTAVANVTAPTAAGAVYTAMEQTLLNDIRTRLINFGIYT